MAKEPMAMAKLHKIREEHYEETKEMSLKEVLEEASEEAKVVMERHGLNLRYATGRLTGVKADS